MIELLRYSALNGRKIHLGVCGSIAAYKAIELLRLLCSSGFSVTTTLTQSAVQFVTPLSFSSLGAERVYTSLFDDSVEEPFSHLDPGAWADLFCIAPASATTLARLAHGSAEEVLSAQTLAFLGPLVIAPAMNPRMWSHPATQYNLTLLKQRGAHIVEPDCGLVACGDSGSGKLAALADIYYAILGGVSPQDLDGKTVLITMGPTQEQWDGVRFWTNPSTGFMGLCFAIAAWLRGATVHAVTGPISYSLPAGIKSYGVRSAKEMYERTMALWQQCDIGIFTAAVADFSPEPFGSGKFKKSSSQDGFSINFLPNHDILASCGSRRLPHQKLVGFAAETTNLAASVAAKLASKKADLIVGNLVGSSDSGFASKTNSVFLKDRQGREAKWDVLPKPDVAWRVLDWLLSL